MPRVKAGSRERLPWTVDGLEDDLGLWKRRGATQVWAVHSLRTGRYRLFPAFSVSEAQVLKDWLDAEGFEILFGLDTVQSLTEQRETIEQRFVFA